jgi:enamine deaminase RidA (YjgF/YER057c/UK114 family)
MKQRSFVFVLTVGLMVAFSAGLVVAKGKGLLRLDLPGRSDDRPYTHTIVAGKTIYIAGSIGFDPVTGRVPEDPMKEARIMLDAMKAKVELAGVTMNDLVSVQVFCSDISLYGDFNELYASYFEKGQYPVRAFVGSGELLGGARFEINGIAYKS